MVELDKLIDNNPTPSTIKQLAELRIRNLQAFRELEEFNSTGKFFNKHPLVKHYSLRVQLEDVLVNSPEVFLEDYANTRENVKRYKSFLNSKGRTNEQKVKDKKNLKKHSDREALMKEILCARK